MNRVKKSMEFKLSKPVNGRSVYGYKILDNDGKIYGEIWRRHGATHYVLDLSFVPDDVKDMNFLGFNTEYSALDVARIQFQSFWKGD